MSPERINISRASWIHKRAGVDYGPYDSRTLADMVSAGDVTRDDSLLDQFTGVACNPADVPLFREALEVFEAQQRESQIAREAETSYATLKKRRVLIPILLVLVTFLSVATGWERIRAWMDPSSRHTALAAVTVPLTPDANVVIRALPSYANTSKTTDASSSEKDTSNIAVRAHTPRSPRPRRKAINHAQDPKPSPVPNVQEFDFAADDANADEDGENLPRPLGASEIRELLSETLKPLVVRCARVNREELVHSIYRVHLKLLPSGSLKLTRITPGEANVPGLRGCVDLLAKRTTFRKFTGSARELDLPIKVR